MQKQAATIYSLARELGVHPSTVSRAFSRPELVKKSVRERVLARAAEVDYRPNRAARGLITGRSGMISLIVPDIENPFFPPLVRAIQNAAARSDLNVMMIDSEEHSSSELDLISRLKGQVDGMILASPRSSMRKITATIGDLPLVVINRSAADVSSASIDNTDALREAGDHLFAQGHSAMALLRGPSTSWAARRRSQAVLSWAQQAGVGLFQLGPFPSSFDGGLQAATQMMQCGATAAFAFDDVMACGVIAGLSEHGLAVPDDVSLVGCDDVLLARMLTPALTTITAPVTELGTRSVDLLEARLHGDLKVRTVTLKGTLTIRASTGPCRAPVAAAPEVVPIT